MSSLLLPFRPENFQICEPLRNIVRVFRPFGFEGYSHVRPDAAECFEGNFNCVQKISPGAQFMGKENLRLLLLGELTSYVATYLLHFVSLIPYSNLHVKPA